MKYRDSLPEASEVLMELMQGNAVDSIDGLVIHQKLACYDRIKCGNNECTKNYLMDKYGIDFVSMNPCVDNNGSDKDRKGIIKLNKQWNQRKKVNKWYICNGCKIVKYCSSKCQKIAWNKRHRMY